MPPACLAVGRDAGRPGPWLDQRLQATLEGGGRCRRRGTNGRRRDRARTGLDQARLAAIPGQARREQYDAAVVGQPPLRRQPDHAVGPRSRDRNGRMDAGTDDRQARIGHAMTLAQVHGHVVGHGNDAFPPPAPLRPAMRPGAGAAGRVGGRDETLAMLACQAARHPGGRRRARMEDVDIVPGHRLAQAAQAGIGGDQPVGIERDIEMRDLHPSQLAGHRLSAAGDQRLAAGGDERGRGVDRRARDAAAIERRHKLQHAGRAARRRQVAGARNALHGRARPFRSSPERMKP